MTGCGYNPFGINTEMMRRSLSDSLNPVFGLTCPSVCRASWDTALRDCGLASEADGVNLVSYLLYGDRLFLWPRVEGSRGVLTAMQHLGLISQREFVCIAVLPCLTVAAEFQP